MPRHQVRILDPEWIDRSFVTEPRSEGPSSLANLGLTSQIREQRDGDEQRPCGIAQSLSHVTGESSKGRPSPARHLGGRRELLDPGNLSQKSVRGTSGYHSR